MSVSKRSLPSSSSELDSVRLCVGGCSGDNGEGCCADNWRKSGGRGSGGREDADADSADDETKVLVGNNKDDDEAESKKDDGMDGEKKRGENTDDETGEGTEGGSKGAVAKDNGCVNSSEKSETGSNTGRV